MDDREKMREDHRPGVKGLFIAESPPEHAFFYYPSPEKREALFYQLMRVIYKDDFRSKWEKTFSDDDIVELKNDFLDRFAFKDGLYLTDASKTSLHGSSRKKASLLKKPQTIDSLISEVNELIPDNRRKEVGVFLISWPTFEACNGPLRKKFRIINDEMIAFPNPHYPDLVKRFRKILIPLWDAYWKEI